MKDKERKAGWKSENSVLNPLDDEEEEAMERASVHANSEGVDNASEAAENTEEAGTDERLGVNGGDTGVVVVDDEETGVGVMKAGDENDDREGDEDEDEDKGS